MTGTNEKERPVRPNILLIISDQHRADTLGFKKIVDIKTPFMDELFQTGISFDLAITPSPLCGPARTSIFTGKYPHQAKGRLDQDLLGIRPSGNKSIGIETDMMINDSTTLEDPILTNSLKQKGYYNAYAGKWHLGNSIINNWFDDAWGYDNQQYIKWCEENNIKDAWALHDSDVRSHREPHMSIPKPKLNKNPENLLNDAWITDIALKFLKNRPKDNPFFIVCSYNGPHPPFKIPEPYYSMYNPNDIPEPVNFHPSKQEPETKGLSFYRQLWKDHGEDWEKWKKSVAVYRGYVSLIDNQIGRLISYLDETELRKETLIIYCSDHGEMLGQHGLWHKMQAYEESLRVPLIFSAPWIPQGSRSQDLSSLIDIPPTLLNLIGLPQPVEYEGSNLRTQTTTDQKSPQNRIFLFSEHRPLGEFHKEVEWRMITDNIFKFIWNLGDINEFYNLNNDPYEKFNLINSSELEKEIFVMKENLINWMEKSSDPFLNKIKQKE
jgi:arylsulfatase A-like enzyme